MNINDLRRIIASESPTRLLLGTIVTADPRGIPIVSVRLNGGRVCRNVSTCVPALAVGDQVLVMRTKDRDRIVVVGKVGSQVEGSWSRDAVLAPPPNFTALELPLAVACQWDVHPSQDICHEVQLALDPSKSDATTVLIAHGNYYIYPCVAGTTAYFRVRAIRWMGDNNVMYSAWSSWADGTSTSVGAGTFLELTDTPSSYTSQASKLVAVKAAADGLEFITAGSLSGNWAAPSHSHVEGDITDLDHNAVKIQGRAVAATAPNDGDALVWDSVAATWEPGAVDSSEWSVLANGDSVTPELIFAFGDTIMVEIKA